MRNSRICPENNARFSNLMCKNAQRAALTLSLDVFSLRSQIIGEMCFYKGIVLTCGGWNNNMR